MFVLVEFENADAKCDLSGPDADTSEFDGWTDDEDGHLSTFEDVVKMIFEAWNFSNCYCSSSKLFATFVSAVVKFTSHIKFLSSQQCGEVGSFWAVN